MALGARWLTACLAGLLSAQGVSAQTPEEPPAPRPAPAPHKPWSKGFVLADDDGTNVVRIGGRVMVLAAHEDPDVGPASSAMSIPRARAVLLGQVFDPRLTFRLQLGFGRGQVALKDALFDYAIVPDWLLVRAGQWVLPWSRAGSSRVLELVDRDLTARYFGGGRDVGVALHSDYEYSPPFEYVVGVFNGTGDRPVLTADVMTDPATGEGVLVDGEQSNVPRRFKPSVLARVAYNQGPIRGYSQGDLEGGPLRLSLGAGAWYDFDEDGGSDPGGLRANLDAVLKAHGSSALAAVYVSTRREGDVLDLDTVATGFWLQVGHVFARRFQPVVRIAQGSPWHGPGRQRELTAGFSIYFHGHSLKWQSDLSRLTTTTADGEVASLRARTQVQLGF